MSLPIVESGQYKNFTGTNTISAPMNMLGIFVSSSTAGTIAITDGASEVVVGAFTGVAGTYYKIPATLSTDCRITVTGTINATIFWS